MLPQLADEGKDLCSRMPCAVKGRAEDDAFPQGGRVPWCGKAERNIRS